MPIDSRAAVVDPRGPRFGQALTATIATAAVVLADPRLVVVLAVLLGTAVLSRWRVDVAAVIWRHVVAPRLGASDDREPAAPHRFAKVVGATTTTAVALPFLALGGALAVVGYVLVAVVAVLAALGATTGFCLGCRMYREVAVFRRAGIV